MAEETGSAEISVEHLLATLTQVPEVRDVVATCGDDPDALHAAAIEHLDDAPGRATPDRPLLPSILSDRLIRDAKDEAEDEGAGRIDALHLLQAMLALGRGRATYLLRSRGFERARVAECARVRRTPSATSGDVRPPSGRSAPDGRPGASPRVDAPEPAEEESGTDPLATYCTDMTAAAERNHRPVTGRSAEIGRAVRALARKDRRNVLLVGESGVGKTAVAEALAAMSSRSDAPAPLRGARVLALDLAAVLAGTRYRGDLEERMRAVVRAAAAEPGAILFLDEAHAMVDAGSGSSGMNMSTILKPALERGSISLIAATTPEEKRTSFDRDPALARRFLTVTIGEPDRDSAVDALNALVPGMEEHHGVAVESGVAAEAVDGSVTAMPHRNLPEKAVDLLDETCADAAVAGRGRVTREDVRRAAESHSGPAERGATDPRKRERLLSLESDLRAALHGQPEAAAAVSRVVRTAEAGLRRDDKPRGAFLFAGGTGTGKTHTARTLAELMEMPLTRFDMSEYAERHAVSRLLGAPPGYAGHDRSGQLAAALRGHPDRVLLLDEIDRAHPDVHDLLLQALDAGRVTDASGEVVDLRRAYVVLTTNAGAPSGGTKLGFAVDDRGCPEDDEIVASFRPELRSRLDATVRFAPVDESVARRIVDDRVREMAERLERFGLHLDADERLLDAVARRGLDAGLGGRGVEHEVDAALRSPLADAVISGASGTVRADLDERGATLLVLPDGTRLPPPHRPPAARCTDDP